MGIIPRAVRQLYAGIAARQEAARDAGVPPPEFKVSATFLELYNEDIIDLVTCYFVASFGNQHVKGLG